ncbi:hypothetical protein B0H13DRAFT_2477562 [Mycena leptocephala]|nr:hypothetical protein B0H13DRAFT_2477562 [Mycena leptocephala]
MSPIPQELVDAIVQELLDSRSLIACTLVGSAFREPSQRILLRSATLGGETTSYGMVRRIVHNSPRIASYVRMLHLILPAVDTALTEIESLQQVLGTFANVHQLIIQGCTDDGRWDRLPPSVAHPLVNLIQHPKLEGLHLLYIRYFPADLLASSAATFSFRGGSVAVVPSRVADHPKNHNMENLILFPDCKIRGDVLLSSFVRRASKLRRLWVCPDPRYMRTVVASSAGTLEELYLDCHGKCPRVVTCCVSLAMPELNLAGYTTPPLPVLPSIRFVCVRLDFTDRNMRWFVDTMCALLSSAAKEIIVAYVPDYVSLQSRVLAPETMRHLNDALRGRPVFPSIRWRLSFDGNALREFAAAVERGIPRAHESGKQIVEYSAQALFCWPSGSMII